MKKFFIALFVAFIGMQCGAQKDSVDLQTSILGLMKKYDAVGVAVAVVKDDSICYLRTFGYNPDYRVPKMGDTIASDGIFRIASISKTFVATAIMQLVEKGRVRLDDDVDNYLDFKVRNPRYPQKPITIRMLMSHCSSITDYQYSKYKDNFEIFVSTERSVLESLYSKYPPGQKFQYSNYGYNLLGGVIEKVTGIRFDEFIKTNILRPLGLIGGYDISTLDSSKLVWALQYNQKKERFVKSPRMYKPIAKELQDYTLGKSTALFSPCGGMKLSVKDLARYMMMHINYGTLNGVKLLSKESEEVMWKKQRGSKYGMGFQNATFGMKGVDLIGHQGGAYGIHSSMFFSPERKYGFVVICNGCKSGHEFDTSVLKELYTYFIEKQKITNN